MGITYREYEWEFDFLTLAEELLWFLEENGITQAEFASAVSLSSSEVSAIVTMKNLDSYTVKTLLRVANAIDIAPSVLFTIRFI